LLSAAPLAILALGGAPLAILVLGENFWRFSTWRVCFGSHFDRQNLWQNHRAGPCHDWQRSFQRDLQRNLQRNLQRDRTGYPLFALCRL